MSRSRYILTALTLIGLIAPFGRAQSPNGRAAPAGPTTTTAVKLSQAERIVRLEQSIEAGERDLVELKKSLDETEYGKAKAEFTRVDKRLKEREKELTTQPAPAGENPLVGLQRARELAKERFDLAIQENTTVREKLVALEKKLLQDREALARMKSPSGTASQPAVGAGSSPAAMPSGSQGKPAVTPTANAGPSAPAQTAPDAVAAPTTNTPAIPTLPGIMAAPSATVENKPAATTEGSPEQNKDLLEAREQALTKQQLAKRAESDLAGLAERIATVRENIRTESQLQETARKKAKNASESCSNLRDDGQSKIASGAPAEETTPLWARLDDAERRTADAEAAVTRHVEQMDQLQGELAQLQADYIDALRDAEQKRKDAEQAQTEIKELTNPFAPQNLLRWLLLHGPKLVGIAIGMLVLLWVTRVAESRMSRLIAIHGGRGTTREKEDRAKTLASVFRNVLSTAVVTGGVLMLLTEFGLNIVPLLGGAAVIGLAAAFGAQNLIKDYFYGFIIILENQYAINDVIRVGEVSGVVERITLRMTALRDVEGTVHFIPHGEASKVSNLTHGWSRAVFDIGVSYNENVDHVISVLRELARELRRDPIYESAIIGEPEMCGVDAFGDSAVIIKFLIKTRALKQWDVKREMLRRIKNKFDELGIEIPYPHRVVYHRHELGGRGPGDESRPALPRTESQDGGGS